jgi:CheY-like chemotaxis protein
VIEVGDTGPGLTPEQLGQLFQPYNRLGREHSGIEGTGIGLVISRRLAGLMGGRLDASSEPGVGTCFELRLPAARDDVASIEAEPAPTALTYSRRLVHYVEDNETNIEVMRGILLQRPQIELGVTMLGLDALSAIRSAQPQLILLDMHLPDISGLELLRHLKGDPAIAGIPVIVVSADATTQRIQEALTLGAAHYVTKPIELRRFLGMVDEVLEGLETRWM